MLIKLILVNSYHFIRYKCKITHCLDSQTSEYLSTIVLNDNEKLLTEVLKVLIGVGTFTSTSSFDTQSLQFVTKIEFKKSLCQDICNFLHFTLQFYTVSTFCWNSKLLHTRQWFKKMGQLYLSIVEKYFSVEVTHNLHIFLMNNTPSKSYSVDFIHYKYCFPFHIEQIDVQSLAFYIL